jgi:hypothetical protein
LWYDTELENVYILGDFSVDGERNILAPASPMGAASLQDNGFPYFSGRVSFTLHIFGEKSKARLTVDGEYAAAEISVNGKPAGRCLFEDQAEIELAEGKDNEVTVTAVSTLRNTFGPFHFVGNEDDGVSPFSFTMRGAWQDGKCIYFLPEYKLRNFGIDKVSVSFEK